MKHTMIWYGRMTHGTFTIGGDENPMVIVYSIDERVIMDPDDVDEYMHSEGHDSYLVPDEFTGEIVFSQSFFKGLTNDTY
jgi:hypothetical protein